MTIEQELEEIEIIGFFAKNNLKLCQKFTMGHTEVLAQHGFLHFKSYDDYWYNLKGCYVILAIHENKAVGGIRLELKEKDKLLPYEKVLVKSFPQVASLDERLNLQKLAEPCSLWNSKIVSGKNLSIFLSRASIAMAHLLDIKNIISFNATYTFRIPQDVGCKMITSLGDNGYFNYPTEKFRAALWLHDDLQNLSIADPISKERMMDLRKNRKQVTIEEYDSKSLKISYDLKI